MGGGCHQIDVDEEIDAGMDSQPCGRILLAVDTAATVMARLLDGAFGSSSGT
jgi:hypothetical protein